MRSTHEPTRWATRQPGRRVERRSQRTEPDLDALFALASAAVTLEAATGLRPAGAAGVTFTSASGQAFASTAADLEQLVRLAAEASQAAVQVSDDDHGYRWIVLDNPEVEDLVTTVHLGNRSLADEGFGHQLLASVFAFPDADDEPEVRGLRHREADLDGNVHEFVDRVAGRLPCRIGSVWRLTARTVIDAADDRLPGPAAESRVIRGALATTAHARRNREALATPSETVRSPFAQFTWPPIDGGTRPMDEEKGSRHE